MVLQESSCEGGDAIRKLVRHTIQAVLDKEMTVLLNAGGYERTKGRRGYRNGYKSRMLITRVGWSVLMVPKDREGWFQTKLFEKYQRCEKARWDGAGIPQGVLIVLGIDEKGYREVLGMWCADLESEATWSGVFRELRERGLMGVGYVVSFGHEGLTAAISRYFQEVVWQRCQVYFIRDILGKRRKKTGGR